jgi:hypothetical protein
MGGSDPAVSADEIRCIVVNVEVETGLTFRLEDIHTALQYTERKAKLNGKGDDYIPVLFENELRDFVMREIINTRGRMNKCVIPAT